MRAAHPRSLIRRTSVALAVAALTATTLTACSSDDDNGSGGDGDALSVSIFVPETDNFSQQFQEWSGEIEEATEGRVTFEPYYGGTLTTVTNAYEAVADGRADVALVAATALSNHFPELSFLEGTGYLTGELDPAEYTEMYDAVKAPLAEVMSDVHLLAWSPSSLNPTFADRQKQLTTPADFEGRIIRAAGKLQGEQLGELGASPTTVDPSELQVALQTGTVDAAIYTPTLIESGRLFEVAPQMTRMDNTAANTIMWIMNSEAWAEISEADQRVIDEIMHETGVAMPSSFDASEEESWENLADTPAELTVLEEDQQAAILEQMRPALLKAADTAAAASDAGAELVRLFGLDQQ